MGLHQIKARIGSKKKKMGKLPKKKKKKREWRHNLDDFSPGIPPFSSHKVCFLLFRGQPENSSGLSKHCLLQWLSVLSFNSTHRSLA